MIKVALLIATIIIVILIIPTDKASDDWYNTFSVIMTDAEKYFYDKLNNKEKNLFKLAFNESRDKLAFEFFYERNTKFKDDRRALLILHGAPFEIREIDYTGIDNFGATWFRSSIKGVVPDIKGIIYQLWIYYWNERGRFVNYLLAHKGNDFWQRVYLLTSDEVEAPQIPPYEKPTIVETPLTGFEIIYQEDTINIQFDEFDKKKYYGIADYSPYWSLLYNCSLPSSTKEKIYKKLKKEKDKND